MIVVINLIIAHSHPHFLFMLQNIIRSYQGFRVVGKTGNYADLMQMATALKPDVIIADIELPGMKGFTALQQLMADLNQPKIILSWRYHHQPLGGYHNLFAGQFMVKALTVKGRRFF